MSARRELTGATVEQVAISAVNIGVRRRKTLGRLDQLQRSIEAHGLIHPIVLHNGNELVAGGRRLEACTRLGWKTIPARRVETMSADELRAIELEENSERLALNDFEASKARMSEIRQAEADLKTARAKETREHGSHVSVRGTRGPAKTPGSRRDVAAVTGVAPATQRKIESHVATAEQYPFMQKAPWVQHQVLHAGAELAKLPEADRPKAAALLDQEAIPPKKAVAILENLASLPAADRKVIFKMAQSEDTQDRRNALSRAAALPDNPDPGLLLLAEASRVLKRALRECRIEALKAPLRELAEAAAQLDSEFSKRS